jgi:hypothetical protein
MRKISLAIVTAAGLLLFALPAAQASASATGPPKIPGNNTHRPSLDQRERNGTTPGISVIDNENWSGYVATGKTFSYVTGSYTVPSVNCTKTPTTFSYHWVGLDGASDGTVEQDGIGSFCNGSTPYYFGWAWMYPTPGEIKQITVSPGDAITSSVDYASGVYTLRLTDQTSGASFDVTSKGTYGNSSAEAITEGYPTSGENGTADFGEEHYDTIKVTDTAGQHGGLESGDWSTDEYIPIGASNDVDTQPGPLLNSSTQSAFEVTWEHEN